MDGRQHPTGRQLALFENPLTEATPDQGQAKPPSTSETFVPVSEVRYFRTGPPRVGSATVSYVDTKSLLTAPAGFMGPYKFTLNPYSGCGFGCEYCYARFFAPTLEAQESWGEWVRVKANAIELLRKARVAKSATRRLETGDAIYMSSVTDPYQPIEQRLGLTRAILEELVEVQPRLTIQTRSPIATRDIDLFRQFKRIRVNFTITTDSEEMRLRYEPHCPAIEVRLQAAEAVARAGVPIGISISPMLPIRDAETFARRLTELDATEYVTQYFKPTRLRFSAGSSPDAVRRLRDDQWTHSDYEQVRLVLVRILGSGRPLLEGAQGYAPAT